MTNNKPFFLFPFLNAGFLRAGFLQAGLFALGLFGLSGCSTGPIVPHVRTMPLETPEQVG